jgi:hypothetical protein
VVVDGDIYFGPALPLLEVKGDAKPNEGLEAGRESSDVGERISPLL